MRYFTFSFVLSSQADTYFTIMAHLNLYWPYCKYSVATDLDTGVSYFFFLFPFSSSCDLILPVLPLTLLSFLSCCFQLSMYCGLFLDSPEFWSKVVSLLKPITICQ